MVCDVSFNHTAYELQIKNIIKYNKIEHLSKSILVSIENSCNHICQIYNREWTKTIIIKNKKKLFFLNLLCMRMLARTYLL